MLISDLEEKIARYARIGAMTIRIVFMGSPTFSLPALKALSLRFSIAGVVTQPDQPSGRGQVLKFPPVKRLANELGLPIIQPQRVRHPDAMAQLRAWQPDMIVVAAFGQILRPELLELPPLGCINIHASLLPRWRGAAPIQAAILHGDATTGVTIMRMDPGVDTGDIYAQKSLLIQDGETAGTLSDRLAQLGADLLMDVLPAIASGNLLPTPQDHSQATLAPMLKKEDGLLDIGKSAATLANQVRAFNPWPGSHLFWRNQPLKVHAARAVEKLDFAAAEVGRFVIYQKLPAVITQKGLLLLELVQPAGKKVMPGQDFLRGIKNWENQN